MDGLRAVAALAVVMIHVSAGRMNPVGVCCNQTARFAVPLFVMLSGCGHMYSWLQPIKWVCGRTQRFTRC